MIEIICVCAFVIALILPVLAIIHYVKNCNNGKFVIKGELLKLFKFEIQATGTKKNLQH